MPSGSPPRRTRDGEHVRAGYPAEHDAADVKRRVAVAQGAEILAVAKADADGPPDSARSRPARVRRAGHHDRGHLAVAGDHRGEPIVQFAFARDHRIVVEIAEQVVHPPPSRTWVSNTRVACSCGDCERAQQDCRAPREWSPRQASQPPPANTSNGSRTDATTRPRKAHGAPALPLLSLILDAVSPAWPGRCCRND